MKKLRSLSIALVTALASPTGVATASAQVVEGEEHCVVNVATWDRLNVRDEPKLSGSTVARLRYGECGVLVVGEPEGNWYPIEDGHNEGWVHGHFISMVSPALYCISGVDEDDVLNLRAFPSPISRIIVELDPYQCDIAFLPYAVQGWQKVRVEGYEGWVSRKYLSGGWYDAPGVGVGRKIVAAPRAALEPRVAISVTRSSHWRRA